MLAAACGSSDRGEVENGANGGPGGDAGGDDGDGGPGTEGTSGGGDGSDGDGGMRLDVGDSGVGPLLENCVAVDLLFVIDNSPSMLPHQQELTEAFPGFVDAIYANLPEGIDIHVGITSTSFSDDIGRSCDIGCMWYSNACGTADEYGCDRQQCYDDAAASGNGFRGRLFEWDGKSYFATNTEDAEEADLQAWFAAAATALGDTGNNYEFSAAAASWAVGAPQAALNSGFLRDESAVLFMFFLTDQWDESVDTLESYVAIVDEAKTECNQSLEEGSCVVTAGLLNPCTVPDSHGGSASSGMGDWDEGGKGPNGDPGDLLWQLMTSFTPQPVWGSILEPESYADVVGQALADVILEKCEEIPPPAG
jgi:hypothetical protein